jgi:hypothetical protein
VERDVAHGLMARRWSTSDDRLLASLYEERQPLVEIARRLGRSADAVTARRRQLGIPTRRAWPPWTDKEEALLRLAARAGVPTPLVSVRLGRSPEQVRWRRRALGLTRRAARPYSTEEDAQLAAALADGGDLAGLAARLGRSPDALRLRARKLGLHRPRPRRRWTEAEDAVVRDGYAEGLTCSDITRELPGRTPTAIAARARALGIATYARVWTPRDDALLRQLARTHSIHDAARALGRTPAALRKRSARLGVAPPRDPGAPRNGAAWTADEDELLRLHPGLNPAKLAELLGRSDAAVGRRLAELGLRAGRHRSPHHTAPPRRNGTAAPGVVRARAA